jgi:uncharacterized protein with ParB-like and HNH nuclease domain
LINLLHLSHEHKSEETDWIKGKIAGHVGKKKQFWMNHERHRETLDALYRDDANTPTQSGVTAANMLNNYNLINDYLNSRLDSKHKFETFVYFFLYRLVLINLSVEQTDVPMVFEVINDRGVRLRPYEILKGKLLGQIDKIELDSGNFNGIWEDCVSQVNRHKSEEIDVFFVYYLKAKFADTRAAGQRFDNDYHREMFKADLNEQLELDRNPAAVKKFLKNEFAYFTSLYSKIWSYASTRSNGFEAVNFNRLNEMDSQFMLIISACVVNDPDEENKINFIAAHVDRLFALLRLQRAYDSNEFNEAVFEISRNIRDKPISEIGLVFETKLKELLKLRSSGDVLEAFEFSQFKNTSINDIPSRFTRYFFARVDEFIAAGTKTGIKHPIEDLVFKTGAKTGFHIEHILSRNPESIASYGGDEERFNVDRNRLGGVLLMKGKDNISRVRTH